jgi:hypothetical protein
MNAVPMVDVGLGVTERVGVEVRLVTTVTVGVLVGVRVRVTRVGGVRMSGDSTGVGVSVGFTVGVSVVTT